MLSQAVADLARWSLVVVFALAATEKTDTLRSRSAAWHPVLLSNDRLRRHATPLIAASLTADGFAIVLLVLLPRAGAAVSAVLVVLYSLTAWNAHFQADCRCFWRVLNTSSRVGFLGRNCALLVLAGLGTTIDPQFGLSHMAGALGMMVALVLGTRGLDYLVADGRQFPATAGRSISAWVDGTGKE
jgi:methylamine utilization protein MauE